MPPLFHLPRPFGSPVIFFFLVSAVNDAIIITVVIAFPFFIKFRGAKLKVRATGILVLSIACFLCIKIGVMGDFNWIFDYFYLPLVVLNSFIEQKHENSQDQALNIDFYKLLK